MLNLTECTTPEFLWNINNDKNKWQTDVKMLFINICQAYCPLDYVIDIKKEMHWIPHQAYE